jgi:hypothetical protein
MTTAALDDLERNGPRLLLADHHEAIEAGCRDIEIGIQCDDPLDLVQRYRAFEKAVLEHLAAEEDELLDAYATYDQSDAITIRERHADLRRQLDKIGIEVELHSVRATALRTLIETLQMHARDEDRGMYPWAQHNLPLSARKRLFLRIGSSLDGLARTRRAFANGRHVRRAIPGAGATHE